MATSFSEPKIIRIKVDFYNGSYKNTDNYYDSVHMVVKEDYYSVMDIIQCEIKFRYRFKTYTDILTGDITIKDILKEMGSILKKEFLNERHSI